MGWRKRGCPDEHDSRQRRSQLDNSGARYFSQALHYATQFGEAFQASDVGIAGVAVFVDVVGEKVAMIGAHGHFVIFAVGAPPGQFFFQQGADDANHIRIAVQMFGFIKRIIGNASDLAKMREMNARREFADHGEQIIVGARSIRADAKGEAIRGRVGSGKDRSRIIRGGNHSRNAKKRLRRIVGMNRQAHAQLFRDRRDFPEELDERGTQAAVRGSVPFGARFAKPLARVRRFAAGKSRDDCALEFELLGFGHGVKAVAGRGNAFWRVIALGIRAFEEEEIVRGEIHGIKTQGKSSAGQAPLEIRTRPVHQRHEVVADNMHAGLGNGREGIFPGVDIFSVRPGAKLDGTVNRNAFDDGPDEARGLDLRLALQDFAERPGFAAIDVMQRGDESRCARLLDLLERNRILWTEPSPGFFHPCIVIQVECGVEE